MMYIEHLFASAYFCAIPMFRTRQITVVKISSSPKHVSKVPVGVHTHNKGREFKVLGRHPHQINNVTHRIDCFPAPIVHSCGFTIEWETQKNNSQNQGHCSG